MRISKKGFLGLVLLAAGVVFWAGRSREDGHAERISEVGSEWEWEVSSRDLSEVRHLRIEGRGIGMREGLKKFWLVMLSDDSRKREYQLHWNQEVFSLWSWDQDDLPELSALRRARTTSPKKFERAIDRLVEGQLQALQKFAEEDFDLEADTVSLFPLLHLEPS